MTVTQKIEAPRKFTHQELEDLVHHSQLPYGLTRHERELFTDLNDLISELRVDEDENEMEDLRSQLEEVSDELGAATKTLKAIRKVMNGEVQTLGR